MWITFKLFRTGSATDLRARVIHGAEWNLSIELDKANGPFYPQVTEAEGADRFRFFAGRIVGHHLPDVPLVPPFANAPEPDGGFIALEFDKSSDTLKIASDLFNAQRWFHSQNENEWVISNSLRSLHRSATPKPVLDECAMPYLLRMGYIPEPFTPLKNVFSLATGQQLEISSGKESIKTRAALPVHRRPTLPTDNLGERVADSISAEVKRQIEGLDSIWVPLSGGIDSRFLLACALEAVAPEQIHTLTFGSAHSLDARIGSRLAKLCGVKNTLLLPDERPLREIIDQNFAVAEGLYWTVPDYPVKPFNDLLPNNTMALSGFVGDPVFGSKEGKLSIHESAAGREDELVKVFWKSGTYVNETSIDALLELREHDPLHVKEIFRAIPGETMMERFDHWYFGQHSVNRTMFAVTPARAKAFYVMPFIAGPVLDTAFAIPTELRTKQIAYFAALKSRFPKFYNFPTTRNHGFPLHVRRSPSLLLTRAQRGLLRTLDEKIGDRFGIHLFHSPRANYAHPRELLRKKHRDDVIAAVEQLNVLSVMNPTQLKQVKESVVRGTGVDPLLLRGLLTLSQNVKEYR